MLDVPDKENVTPGVFVSPAPIDTTNKSADHNTLLDKYLPGSTVVGMHRLIICVVVVLYTSALGYGFYTQNVWLIGSLCLSIIIPAMRKIINRYL